MAWFEVNLQLVANCLEAVAFVLLVPHAFIGFGCVRLLAMELLAVWACVLLILLLLLALLLLFLLISSTSLLLISSTARF